MRKEGRAIERRRSSSDPTQSQTPFGSASSGGVPDSGSWILESGVEGVVAWGRHPFSAPQARSSGAPDRLAKLSLWLYLAEPCGVGVVGRGRRGWPMGKRDPWTGPAGGACRLLPASGLGGRARPRLDAGSRAGTACDRPAFNTYVGCAACVPRERNETDRNRERKREKTGRTSRRKTAPLGVVRACRRNVRRGSPAAAPGGASMLRSRAFCPYVQLCLPPRAARLRI